MIMASAEQRVRILVVDDQPYILKLINDLLSLLGYESDVAGGALEAMQLLATNDYDIVLTDIDMPHIDGLELQKHIKTLSLKPDVIFMTGHVDKYKYSDIIQLGAVDFLTKPIRLDDLKAKLNRVLRERNLLNTLKQDILERKQIEIQLRESETLLNTAFDAIQDGISVLDKDLKIVRVNKTMRDWYSHAMPFEGEKKCYEAYHGKSQPCEVCPTLRALASGRLEKEEVPFTQADGVKGTMEVFAFPMIDEVGNVVKVVEYVRDITDRKKVELALQLANNELELRVAKRTDELVQRTIGLEESNIALKVLMKQRETDKKELEKNILFNVKKIVEPSLEKLKMNISDNNQKVYLEIIEANLNDIISPFAAPGWSGNLAKLTPAEMQIADFIKRGKTTKEIASLLSLSPTTIATHRQSIRKKLVLTNKKMNLQTVLMKNNN